MKKYGVWVALGVVGAFLFLLGFYSGWDRRLPEGHVFVSEEKWQELQQEIWSIAVEEATIGANKELERIKAKTLTILSDVSDEADKMKESYAKAFELCKQLTSEILALEILGGTLSQ